MDELDIRYLARRRQHVVHERAGEQLAVGIVIEFLQQRAADALGSAADDLPLHQHRIDDHAAVVRDGVFVDSHASEFDIDLEHRRMRRIGPGDRGRLVVISLLQPGIHAGRPPVIPAGPGCPRHLGERHFGARHADDADAVLAELEVAGRAFQEIGGDGEHLGAQPFARAVDSRR